MKKKTPDAVHTWLIFMKAYRALARPLGAQLLSDAELGPSDFAVLEMLLHKGPQPVNVIGLKVDLNPGSISVAVDRLHERSLVKREESLDDRRVRMVSLTPEGKKIISAAFKRHTELVETIFSVLSADERTHLETLLRKLGLHAESLPCCRKPKVVVRTAVG